MRHVQHQGHRQKWSGCGRGAQGQGNRRVEQAVEKEDQVCREKGQSPVRGFLGGGQESPVRQFRQKAKILKEKRARVEKALAQRT